MTPEQIENLGGLGLFVLGTIAVVKYAVAFIEELKRVNREDKKANDEKQNVFIEEMRKSDEMRVNTYKEILDGLRADSTKREQDLINTLNNLTSTMDNAFHDFSKVLNTVNESMIEVSTQLGNLGVEFHREVGHMSQRMSELEFGMDRINEKLAIEKEKKDVNTK